MRGLCQGLEGLLNDLFQVPCVSGFTPFPGKPVPQPPPFYNIECMHRYMYRYAHIKGSAPEQPPASVSTQPHGSGHNTTRPQWLRVSSIPTIQGRLGSKTPLAFIWDKGALSLFSWRVAMATSHKDISIAGWGQSSPCLAGRQCALVLRLCCVWTKRCLLPGMGPLAENAR